RISGGQSVQCKNAQTRRTVDDYVFETVPLTLDGLFQIELSLLNFYQLDFGAGKIAVRGGEFHVFQFRVQEYVGDRLIHDHRMVDATVERAFFYPDPAG